MRPFFENNVLQQQPFKPMIIVVDTTKSGSASDTFVLPLVLSSTLNETAVIYWGDGSSNAAVTGNNTHQYAAAGIYTVSIYSKSISNINFNNAGDKLKLIEIMQWGDMYWRVLNNAFRGCANVVITAIDQLKTIATVGSSTFNGCSKITKTPCVKAPRLTAFADSTSTCASMTTALKLTELPVTSISGMYYNNIALTSVPLYDTSKVTNFSAMHQNNSALRNVPLYDLQAATSAVNMFLYCTLDTTSYSDFLINLATLPLQSGVSFHGGNSKYNPTAATARAYLISNFGWTITDGGAA